MLRYASLIIAARAAAPGVANIASDDGSGPSDAHAVCGDLMLQARTARVDADEASAVALQEDHSAAGQPPTWLLTTGVVVSGSSETAGSEARKAFDGDMANTGGYWFSQQGMEQWLQFLFSKPKLTLGYAIYPKAEQENRQEDSPKDFKLMDSDDSGSSWKVLDMRSNIGGWGDKPKIFQVRASMPCSSMRLIVTDVKGRGDGKKFVAIREVSFQGYENPVWISTQRGQATASSEAFRGLASKAFDGSLTGTHTATFSPDWHSAAGVPQWLQFEFPEAQVVTWYGISCRDTQDLVRSDSPKDWVVKAASGAAGPWSSVDFKTNVTGWDTTWNNYMHFQVRSPGTWKAYRFDWQDVPGRPSGEKYVVIREIRFYGTGSR